MERRLVCQDCVEVVAKPLLSFFLFKWKVMESAGSTWEVSSLLLSSRAHAKPAACMGKCLLASNLVSTFGQSQPNHRAAVILRDHLLPSDSTNAIPAGMVLWGHLESLVKIRFHGACMYHMSRRQPMLEEWVLLDPTLLDIPAALFSQLCCTSQWIE